MPDRKLPAPSRLYQASRSNPMCIAIGEHEFACWLPRFTPVKGHARMPASSERPCCVRVDGETTLDGPTVGGGETATELMQALESWWRLVAKR